MEYCLFIEVADDELIAVDLVLESKKILLLILFPKNSEEHRRKDYFAFLHIQQRFFEIIRHSFDVFLKMSGIDSVEILTFLLVLVFFGIFFAQAVQKIVKV